GVPLGIVGAGLVRIANGNALHVGLAKETQHDAKALRANANEAHVDFVAWGNIANAAQYAAGHDRKANGRGGGLSQESPARKVEFALSFRAESIVHFPSCTKITLAQASRLAMNGGWAPNESAEKADCRLSLGAAPGIISVLSFL